MAKTNKSDAHVTPVEVVKPPLIRTIGFLLLAFILGATTLAGLAYGGVLPNPQQSNNNSQVTTQTIVRTLTGNDANTDKIEATNQLTEILKAIAASPDPNAIGAEVAEGNYEHVPEILKNSVVYGNEESRRATMVAVIYLAAGLGNTLGGADNIKPISEQAVINSVEAITSTGTVHIPQAIYTKTNVPVTVTMQYDGETKKWMIDGNGLVNMTLTVALYQTAASATASATPTP